MSQNCKNYERRLSSHVFSELLSLAAIVMSLLLLGAHPSAAVPQDQGTTQDAKDTAKDAGKAAKNAGKSTDKAAKKATDATSKASKKAADKTAKTAKSGAKDAEKGVDKAKDAVTK